MSLVIIHFVSKQGGIETKYFWTPPPINSLLVHLQVGTFYESGGKIVNNREINLETAEEIVFKLECSDIDGEHGE